MTNPMEKKKQELDLQMNAKPFLNLWFFQSKLNLEPQSFVPREVNSNLHSSWVNNLSSKRNLTKMATLFSLSLGKLCPENMYRSCKASDF